MFQRICSRPLVAQVASIRYVSQTVPLTFNHSQQLLAKTAKPKAKSKTNKELSTLQAKLKKEKATFKTLKEKLAKEKKKAAEKSKKEKAKEKELKEKEKNAKLLKKAFKTPRALSPFNMYVKEYSGVSLAEASKNWNSLAEDEKTVYQDKADDYNEDMKSTLVPKPKAPVSGFAAYVQQNFVNDGRKVTEIMPSLSADWKALSDSEKADYARDPTEWANYTKELEGWKADRIAAFNESSKTKISV